MRSFNYSQTRNDWDKVLDVVTFGKQQNVFLFAFKSVCTKTLFTLKRTNWRKKFVPDLSNAKAMKKKSIENFSIDCWIVNDSQVSTYGILRTQFVNFSYQFERNVCLSDWVSSFLSLHSFSMGSCRVAKRNKIRSLKHELNKNVCN